MIFKIVEDTAFCSGLFSIVCEVLFEQLNNKIKVRKLQMKFVVIALLPTIPHLSRGGIWKYVVEIIEKVD